ncbi:MCE family protein [Nocardioides sp. Kera G14]|uniref:MCE family protein n=1 Tax=Nocardioides sp. Kera G14 TaxID=2884264 RepID=UPI001D10041F|nr:MlaD family protein [Nocardioides sp. Kera G14]UDY23975.1 MCE family protein [Nocardioides sp. Kera G14]
MITRRVKVQLLVFVILTLVGVAFAGGRYARLDRLVHDPGYTVVGHFLSSGGIYEGAEVDWRGVKVGEVDKMVLTDDGVDVYLDIDNRYDTISTDAVAAVANRSAVGEQYVDLQPASNAGPFLKDGSEIPKAQTRTPLPTEKLLGDAASTVGSVNQDSLATTINELGTAFAGTALDLQHIIDSSTAFIRTADANFDTTTALIRDSNTVLSSQVATSSAITSFAKNLSLFSDVLAGSDPDLRKLIANGAAGASLLKQFLDENNVDLTELLSESVTIGDIVYKRLPGLKQVLVLYPYVVEGGFTVVDNDIDGKWNAHFGLVLTTDTLCTNGYGGTKQRAPQEGSNKALNTNAHCADPATKSNPRGAQNLNRAAPLTGPVDSSTVIGSYDEATKKFTWGAPEGLGR